MGAIVFAAYVLVRGAPGQVACDDRGWERDLAESIGWERSWVVVRVLAVSRCRCGWLTPPSAGCSDSGYEPRV